MLEKRASVYATVTSFWKQLEGLRLLCVPSPPCLAYYMGLIAFTNDGDGRRVRRIIMLEAVVLVLG